MACSDNTISCDASKTVLIYDPVPVEADMWDEGDIVTFEPDESELTTHTNHSGDKIIRSGKAVKWMDISVVLMPCTDFYKALYLAWIADPLVCGELIINSDCCSPRLFTDTGILKMGIAPISFDSEPVEVVFRGRIVI